MALTDASVYFLFSIDVSNNLNEKFPKIRNKKKMGVGENQAI